MAHILLGELIRELEKTKITQDVIDKYDWGIQLKMEAYNRGLNKAIEIIRKIKEKGL